MKTLFLTTFASLLCHADSPAPWAAQCRATDKVVNGAKGPQLRVLALRTLDNVALGENASVSPEAIKEFGLLPEWIQQSDLQDPSVRAYAIRKIGQSGFPEALKNLEGLTPAALGPDPSGELHYALVDARHEARLSQISNRNERVAFLEQSLVSDHTWATDKLCDLGSTASLPLIEDAIYSAYGHEERSDEMIRNCQARMQVVLSDVDRVKALGSVLRVGDQPGDPDLMMWAFLQLSELHSPEADKQLARFDAEIEKLPDPDFNPSHQAALNFRHGLLRLQ